MESAPLQALPLTGGQGCALLGVLVVLRQFSSANERQQVGSSVAARVQ